MVGEERRVAQGRSSTDFLRTLAVGVYCDAVDAWRNLDNKGSISSVNLGEVGFRHTRRGCELFIIRETQLAGGPHGSVGHGLAAAPLQGIDPVIIGCPNEVEVQRAFGNFPHHGGEGLGLGAEVLEKVEAIRLEADVRGIGPEINEREKVPCVNTKRMLLSNPKVVCRRRSHP